MSKALAMAGPGLPKKFSMGLPSPHQIDPLLLTHTHTLARFEIWRRS